MRSTTPTPVRGRVQRFRSFGLPSLAQWSIRTITFLTPATRSIAPPIPFTTFPGIIQFARSPLAATSMAPRIAMSICPPRIIAKLSAEEKKLDVGRAVIVCLPALVRSGSASPS
jgi:hypothetical protein